MDNTLSDFTSESCDRLLEENWYRLKDDGNIPTVCPAILRCGSTGPVWLNGRYDILLHCVWQNH